MRLKAFAFWVIMILTCNASWAQGTGQAAPGSSAVDFSPPDTVPFADHDIGTKTWKTVTVTNRGQDVRNLSIAIREDNKGDFSANSTCLTDLKPNKSCDINVLFYPVQVGQNDADARNAKLIVIVDNGQPKEIQLSGRAFHNLGVSPAIVEFENPVGNTTNLVRDVLLTNYTYSPVSSVTVNVAGDFTENHSSCVNIAAGGSCNISIAYSPKPIDLLTGSLTITPNQSTLVHLPRVVELRATRLTHCKFPDGPPWKDRGLWLVMFVSGLYFLGLVLARWHMIAKPARAQIVAEIEAVRMRLRAEEANLTESTETKGRIAAISHLLDQAVYAYRHKHFPLDWGQAGTTPPPATYYPWFTRLFNALFWTRGHELASWSLVHEAELQLVALLPLEEVRARLETAEQELRDLNTPIALALADRIHQSLTSEAALIQDRSRELLQQLLPLLKPFSLPQTAVALLFPELQVRAQNCLPQILDWIKKNDSPAAPPTPADCKTLLQQFAQTAKPCIDLAKEIEGMLPNAPDTLKDVLQKIKDFATQLRTSIENQSVDPQLDWKACADLMVRVKTDVEKLVAELKAAPNQDQTLESLLNSCKLQATLFEAVTRATTPGPNVALLQRILIDLKRQMGTVGEINTAAAAGNNDMKSYRPLLIQLAAQLAPSREFADEIDCILSTGPFSLLTRWKALLAEALSLIYENRDSYYFNVASWHNKMIWLIASALLFIFALAVTLQNAVLLLVGAVGGLLSRLQRAMASADVANDYGATWGALFLSPLTGALSAWGGILLIILGLKFNIFGTALAVDWCNPFDPVTLALALLFGFMERLFDGIAGTVQNKLLSSPSASSSPTPPAPAPKIASISPTSAVLGKEVQLTVRGDNFQSGATATLTDESGTQQKVKNVEFKDAKTVLVTCTPSGSKAFTATLAITNPDKQSDTSKLSVTAG